MTIGDVIEVTSGAFAGYMATVIEIEGDHVDVEVTLFGRPHRVTLMQDELSPLDVSVAKLEREVVSVVQRRGYVQRIRHFWELELARTPPRDPAERIAAFAAWAEPIERAQAAAELDALARFRAAFAGLDDAARAVRWLAEQATWMEWREQAASVDAELGFDATIAEAASAFRNETERSHRNVQLAAGPEPEPRNEELEQQIERDVTSDAGFLVYSDWLQAHGHPRGELIALTAAGVTEGALLLQRLEPRLLGPLAGFADQLALRWRLGYVDAIRLETTRDDERDGIDLVRLVGAALRTPSLRFARELAIALPSAHEELDLHAALASAGPRPALRKLALFTNTDEEMLSWTSAGELSGLAELYPNLESLEVDAGTYALTAPHFPRLERLALRTCRGTRAHLRAVADGDWPRLASLAMGFGSKQYGVELSVDDFMPLLESTRLPALRSLELTNCELTDELCAAVLESPLLPRLSSLALTGGTMTEVGARTLIRGAERLRHLATIDVDNNYLDETILAELQTALPQVTSDEQRRVEVYDGAERYAAVGE